MMKVENDGNDGDDERRWRDDARDDPDDDHDDGNDDDNDDDDC